MRKIILVLGAAAATLALSACGRGGNGVFGRGGPDEFAVSRQAPLTIPPDFALVPPRPGAPRAQDADSSTQALQAMFGGAAPRSGSESGVISQAGGARADQGIRSSAADPGTTVVDKGAVTRDIIAAPEGAGDSATATTPQ